MLTNFRISEFQNIEIEAYTAKIFGLSLLINTDDHRGFRLEFSFWWTLAIQLYDSRHADQYNHDGPVAHNVDADYKDHPDAK